MPEGGLLALILLLALLYSAVGHGGASGYLAAMALYGLAPEDMKPAALVMNVFVAALVLLRWRARRPMPWALLLPVVLPAVPAAFAGGLIQLEDQTYRWVVGLALLAAAGPFLLGVGAARTLRPPQGLVLGVTGVGLGFLAGLTGVGGGVYLSPLLLMLGWSGTRDSGAVAAAFILCNSLAGLGGHALAGGTWPEGLPWLVAAALAGAAVGSRWLVWRLSSRRLLQLLGLVLVIAGLKSLAGAGGFNFPFDG